ncbi:TPA: hypothetical protein DCQ44_01645 [Candidatus Taylorbacteria bacterium]|nr:hypothetical protein [Candidatus Taylorbacteria bacterium]
MKGLSIMHVDMQKFSSDTWSTWTKLYCDIRKEPPWNENFWYPTNVGRQISEELTRPHGEAIVALVNCVFSLANVPEEFVDWAEFQVSSRGQRVVGFTYGYSVNILEMRTLAGCGLLNSLFKRTPRVYYIDELGVDMEYRGLGIAKSLTRKLIEVVKDHGLSCITLRIDKQAYRARHFYEKLGFTEISMHDGKNLNPTYWALQL